MASTRKIKNTLNLEGELLIHNAAELKEKISAQFKEGVPPDLNLKNVTAIDLSFLQTLVSLAREAKGKRQRVKLKDCPLVCKQAIDSAGLSGYFSEWLNVT